MTIIEESIMTLTVLRNQIDQADHRYHNGLPNNVGDGEYDRWKRQLKELAPDDERLTRVGSPVPVGSHLQKHKHTQLVGSLNNAMNAEEFTQWAMGLGVTSLAAQPKMDGLSLVLYYRGGVLQNAVTRGDGSEGEDVTFNAILFRGVPRVLTEPFTGSIRGEVVLHNSTWRELDPEETSNPRNLAAGIARRKSGEDADQLDFYAFDIEAHGNEMIDTIHQAIGLMQHLGMRTVETQWLIGNSMGVMIFTATVFHQNIMDDRDGLDYMIDGVVFKVDDLKVFRSLGVTNSRPKGAIAFKFVAEEATTMLTGVRWTVGHTGRVTPVADLDPVRIDGVTVSSVTLHNMDEIKRLDLAVPCLVRIVRAGQVIPKIVGLSDVQPRSGVYIEPPTNIDGYPVAPRKNTDGSDTVDLYVDLRHPAVQRGKIMNWIKKVGIDGLGPEILDAAMATMVHHGPVTDFPGDKPGRVKIGTCYEAPLIETIVDLYLLDDREWGGQRYDSLVGLQVNGKTLGAKRANKIIDQINKTRRLTIDQFLGSLGIMHLGRRKVQLIREGDKFVIDKTTGKVVHPLDDVDNWLSNNFDQLVHPVANSYLIHRAAELGIPGVAREIQDDLDANRDLIESLLKHIDIVPPEAPVAVSDNATLTGQSFCFTGIRPTVAEVQRLKALGGQEKSGVAKGLTYLVAADPNGTSSKIKKARDLGVQVIGYVEFQEMIR